MQKTLWLGAALVLMAGAAQAADLPRKMPVKAPPAPVWSWTGFYVGGYYGTSASQSEATSALRGGTAEANDTGYSGGATVGYNWQFSPIGLLGIEGDIGYLGTKRNITDANDLSTQVGVKSTWYSTLRGRLGYVTGPSVIYATGGAAWGRLEDTFGGTALVGPTTLKKTESGWTAGVGIETKLSRSWTTKTEYLYVDLGSSSFGATTVAGADTASIDSKFHVIKTGLNYKFGEPFELPLFLAPLSSPQRWAGFYVGANAGGGISNVHVPNQTFLASGGEDDVNGTGFAGGAYVGYNLVAYSNWVIGAEGDIGYLGISHGQSDWFNTGAAGTVYQPGIDTNWYGTVRGRVGTSTGPAFLYFTAGLAVVDVENSLVVGATRYSIDGTRVGWTVGGGIETEINSNWSARLESLYIDTGTETMSTPVGSVDFKNHFTVVRGGLTYHFNPADLIKARY
jgi:outer membrane immunogenic protein